MCHHCSYSTCLIVRPFNKAPRSRVAIVTGSSRGIGRAIALRIARDGYDVCINDVAANKSGAEEVAKEIQALGRKATVAIADVSKLNEVEQMVQTAVNELGPLNTMYDPPTRF